MGNKLKTSKKPSQIYIVQTRSIPITNDSNIFYNIKEYYTTLALYKKRHIGIYNTYLRNNYRIIYH